MHTKLSPKKSRVAPNTSQKRKNTTKSKSHKIAIVGPAGAGKGTCSKRLIKDFGYHHISTGDLLRHEIKNNTPLGQAANGYIVKGELVPDQVVIDMVVSAVENAGDKPILLDGFPRTIPQAEALDKVMSIKRVLNLNVPETELVERLSCRWTHLPSGRVYAYDYNPPKVLGFDDETGEALIQRSDDTVEAVKQRLATYYQKTEPLLEYYSKQNILSNYDGSNAPELVEKGRRSDAIYLAMKDDVSKLFVDV